MKNQIYCFNLLAVTVLLVCMVGCRGNDAKPSGGSSFTFPTDSIKRAWLYGEIDRTPHLLNCEEEEYSLQDPHEPFTIQDALISQDELGLSEKDSALIAWVNFYNATIINYALHSECKNARVSKEAIKSPEPIEITENIISDAQLRTAAQHYIDSTRMVTTAPQSSEINPAICEANYEDCLISYLDKQQFTFLSGEDCDNYYDPTLVIPDYDTLLNMDKKNYRTTLGDLKRISAAKNMDEKILRIRIYSKFNRDDLTTVTQALEYAQYSKYLPTLWTTWRNMYQETRGGDWDDDDLHIYNRTYEYMRKHVALIILRHIKEHPDDVGAHNTLLGGLISEPCITPTSLWENSIWSTDS